VKYFTYKNPNEIMDSAFVPPSDSISRDTIIATTKPNSLKRKIRLALFDLGIGKIFHGFPCVVWMKNKK
jgi:hypothetical protein